MMLPPALNAEQVLSFAKMGEISMAGLSHLLLVLVQAVSCISWVLVLLLWMQTHLNVHSVIGRYCSDASYWIYLVHFPVLLLVQAPLTQIQLPVFIEFAMSSLITLCLCFMSYHYLVRFSFVGKLLNGRKVSIASNRYR